MDIPERAELERIMAALADGDDAFVVTLIERFGHRLAGVVRGMVAEMGRHDLLTDRDEIDGIVTDVAFELAALAGGWRPDGALPWVWAERAVRAVVGRAVGHRTVAGDDDLDVEVGGAFVGAGDPDVDGLASLAHLPQVALLLEALAEVANERDRDVYLEFRRQKREGDPSPAHTVAAMTGLRPDNVRQITRRVSLRLSAVLDRPRYRCLVDLPFIAA